MNCIWSTKASGAPILTSNMKVVQLAINGFQHERDKFFLILFERPKCGKRVYIKTTDSTQ